MQEQFKDVGLMTGDVTINPSASCIVMTTEVCMLSHTYEILCSCITEQYKCSSYVPVRNVVMWSHFLSIIDFKKYAVQRF